MAWADAIVSAAQDAAQRVKHFAEDIFPDFSNLPITSNPAVLMVKASDSAMKLAIGASNDFNIRREGIEPFNKLPDGYFIDEQQSTDIQNRSVATLVADYAKATAGKVADAAEAVVDAVTPTPGAMPLWVKFTIAGAVLVGSAVVLNSLMQGGHRAA